MYQVVMHLPGEQADIDKIMDEMARFRADKMLKILCEQGLPSQQLLALLQELAAEQDRHRETVGGAAP